MKLTSLVFLPALLPASVLAGTVVFTDSQHLPTNLPPDVPVVLLDGPDRLQADMFGELPADPQQAEAQVRQVTLPFDDGVLFGCCFPGHCVLPQQQM